MDLSGAGLKLVMESEGLRLFVYQDAAGLATIGWGHRLTAGESYPGGITIDQAAALRDEDVQVAEQAVQRLVSVALTQGQFDALVDFVYNLGAGRLAASTLLELLNASNYAGAAAQLLLWDHGDVEGVETELPALKARREAEYTLWTTAVD